MRIVRPLDRYVFGMFLRVFAVTAIGFPLLVIVMDATEMLSKYLDRKLPVGKVALSYLYFMPESFFLVLPASVLFATVFTIGTLTKHSEIAAAKASGISFYRIIAPIAFGALFATGIGLVMGEIVPVSTARRNAILAEKTARGDDSRYGFAYTAEDGRVYTIAQLETRGHASLRLFQSRRQGTDLSNPTVITIANEGDWTTDGGPTGHHWWHLREGAMHIMGSDSTDVTLHFVGLRDFHMRETPNDMLQKSAQQPDEMQRAELTKYIHAMERSGIDVNETRVDAMLRIAIPATCLIIFLFGAPLATSNQRGGTTFGIGIALATTVLFLMLVQLTKAVGSGGVIAPEVAAWIPGAVFGVAGLVLLARVRT